MNDTTETGDCHYDYANKCDCSEDDKCGCTFPNNLAHDYSPGCFEKALSSRLSISSSDGQVKLKSSG